MSNVDAPDVGSGETNIPDLLAEQSGMPNMSSTKTFVVDTNMQVNGDLDVTGTVTATSFIGDGSQLTGISGGTGGGLDSAAVTLLVDSDYVQARETPQDFAYSSLTGAPTALSSFTNDTSYITAADIPTTVDSDYVAARAPAGGGLDSAAVISLTGTEVQTSAGGIDYSAQSRLRVEDGAIGLSTIDADTGAESLTYSGTTWQLAGNPVGASSQRITHHLWSSSYSNVSLTAANDVYVGTRYAGTKFSYPSMKSYVPTAAQFGGGFEWDHAGTTVLGLSTDGAVFSSSVTATSFVGDGSGLTNLPSNALQVQAPTVTPEYFIYVGSPAGKLAQIQDSRGTATNLVYDQEFATLQEAFNFMMENPLADVGASSYSGGDKNATFVVSLEEGVTHSAGTSGYFRLGHVNAHIKLLSQNALNPAGTTPNVSTVGNFGEALVVYGIPQLQMGGDIVVNADAQIGYSNVKWFYNQYNDDVVWNGPIKIYDGCTFWTDGPINSRIWVETNSYAQVNALNNAALVRVRDGSELVTSDINSNATIQVVSAKLRANNITMNAGTLEVRRFANLHCDSITMNGTSVLYVDDASRVTHAGVSGNTTATNHKIGDAITPYTISEVIDMVNVSNLFTRDGTTFHDQTQTTNSIMVNDLPTTDPVNAGQLWNDAGTLKVSAG